MVWSSLLDNMPQTWILVEKLFLFIIDTALFREQTNDNFCGYFLHRSWKLDSWMRIENDLLRYIQENWGA